MKTPLERAVNLVEQQYKRNPEAVQLAKLASLAVRVEPHLLRRLRLELLPDADVGIEADLWFGPLVESRGVRAIVLNRNVVELLREKLTEDRQLLRRVIALTEQAHAESATTIKLEERLIALAALNEPDAQQQIDEALRPALRTMQVGGEDARQLAQWAMRALAQAHRSVRESRNAIALGLSATVVLGGRPILREVPKLTGGLGDMSWLLRGAISVPPTRIGVELVTGGVAFAEPGGEQPQLELPATNPLVLSLAWKTDVGDAQMLVEAVPGRTVELDANVTQVELRTLSGDQYLLSAASHAATLKPTPLRVMISSTSSDLPEYREQVRTACLQQGMFPMMMEHLPARDAEVIPASLKMVDEADVYLLILGHRYGYVPKEANPQQISVTEHEYNRALERKIPCLTFAMHADHDVKAGDVDTGEGAVKLEAFKARALLKGTYFFRSREDLRAHVVNSLSKFITLPPDTSAETKSKDHPEFSHDLFISYAHSDNLPLVEADDVASASKPSVGWVDMLHERLQTLLGQALGYEPKIWRDGHDLRGNDQLASAISEGVNSSLLLVPIITPRYVQSEWCNREMEAFHASEPRSKETTPSFRSRVFKVVKTPLPDHLKNLEPVSIRNLVGYHFYANEETTGLLTEFNLSDKSYFRMLTRLVADISTTLTELKHSLPETPSAPVTETPVAPDVGGVMTCVYLAETTSDLTREREMVRDDLRERGYVVLPEQKLPLKDVERTQAAVRADLARCALSVHMVSTLYGPTPEDDPRSIVRIQEDLAVERGETDSAFHRLVWWPFGLSESEIRDQRQKAFIEDLRRRIGLGAEFLETSIEDLKTRIVEKLNQAKTPTDADRPSKPKQVYLICQLDDLSAVLPITKYLLKQKLKVHTKRIDLSGARHRTSLIESDAALIYFGSGDESWVRENLEDLERAYGYGRENNWLAKAVYIGAPQSEQKENFGTERVPYVIRNFATFDPNDLRDFVRAVQGSEADSDVRGARHPQTQPPAKQFSGIFVAYRRDDSSGHAGRLFDKLVDHFGKDRIFLDVDRIPVGRDFIEVIENAVDSSDILLAIIGRQWLSERFSDPNDLLRREIARALRRDIPVIPVLVQGATIPRPQDLPDDLAELANRQSIELSDDRWQHDLDKLISNIERVLAGQDTVSQSSGVVAKKFVIRGDVQGVGYRFFAQRAAAQHQVLGFVRNSPDGTVEVLAEGSATNVEAFKKELVTGPRFSKVQQVEEINLEPSGQYAGFRIEQ